LNTLTNGTGQEQLNVFGRRLMLFVLNTTVNTSQRIRRQVNLRPEMAYFLPPQKWQNIG
jgi:hypothetical protein